MKKALLAATLAVPLMVGCDATQVLDDDQLAQVQQLDEQIAALRESQKAVEDTTLATLNQVRSAALAGEKDEAIRLIQLADTQATEFEAMAADRSALLDERQAIIDEGIAGKVSGTAGVVGSLVSAVFPPAAPFVPYLNMLAIPLAGLFFPRGRQRLKVMGERILKGQVLDLAREVTKVFGWTHSNSDPLLVLDGAKSAAMAKGDATTATAIETFKAALTPPPA